uniref:CCDC144C-like coiled-coil domain-containing protein n=1 Tax=Cyprinus carpio carpio TaxID=630221 RepID=A0A9J8AT29_CYPCA
MKKIFNFKKKKGSPGPSETGSVLSASYDVKEKDLGKVHKAALSGDVVKLRQLAKKNDLNQLDKENRTALHIACACGHTDVVHFLVESKVKLNLCDNQNRSALMKAVQCEQDRSVSLLLEHEADPNLVDISGNTALHLAARIPSLPVVLQLLEHSANINAQNKVGNTPLMLAVMENHADMTELLLKEGADVNVKNQEQRSALMIAACNGQISMVRLLLQYDADITVKDDKGWSSDDYAVMNGHHACSHLIIEHGTKRRSLQSPSYFTGSKKKQTSVLGSPGGIGASLALGGPALDKDDTEEISHTDSISRASKSGAADSWPSSDDDDELDLSPMKVNLKKLVSASKKENLEVIADRNADKSWSGSESEPDSEDKGAIRPPLSRPLPSSSTSLPQPPVATPPASLPHPPQMSSTPYSRTLKEEASTEDEEEEDEREEPEEICEKAKDSQNGASKEKRRDFLLELGLEKEDENDESPWDSESGSESPQKKQASAQHTPAKSHRSMHSICEENTEVLRNDEYEDEEETESEIPPKVIKREPVSVLSKLMDSKEANKKTDLMEELGLGDADDLEDASDWDSASTTSKASKNYPVHKLEEEPLFESPAASTLPITPQQQDMDTREHEEANPERNKPTISSTTPLPSPRSLNPNVSSKPQPLPRLRLDSNQRPESEESDWDTDTFSPAKKTASLPNVAEPDAVRRQKPKAEDAESEDRSDASEDVDQAREALQASSVYINKPSNHEPLERPTSPIEDEQEEKADGIPWEERYEKIWVDNEKKETKSQYKNVAAELKERFGELEHKEPPSRLSEQEWKEDEQYDEVEKEADDEDSSEEDGELIVRPTARARSAILLPIPEQRESGLEDSQSESVHRTISVEVSDAELPSDHHNPQIIPEVLTDEAQEPEKRADDIEEPDSGSKEKCPLESGSNIDEEPELHRPSLHVENELQIPHKFLEVTPSDSDEVGEGLWKSRLEGGKEQADGMKGEHQPGVLWDTRGTRERGELDQGKGKKTDTNSGNPKPKQDGMADSRSLGREGSVSPRHLTRSQRRSPSLRPKKEQSTGELETADDFEDLTQSSDTATEELETPVSGYRNASLLFKQLDSSYLDSVSVVKLQNMFHEYERTIQRERDRHRRLADKISQLEQERNELKILLDDIKGSKSSLEHLKLELETDMNNLKFLLRQEQEKHQSALMLYNKTREQLQRKEDQQRAEAEEHHKAELKVRSLELEIRALKNSIRQIEEDRDESQRLLSHERSARALQEELLNNHLRKQQDIEQENLRNLNKSNEAMSQLTEASDRERELIQQNRALLDELNAARAELDRSQCHSRQEESRLAEECDALRERLEDARRDMKLSEEALTQTVFQYNGQLSALKAECSVITAKLDHERQVRQQLEAEAEASRARLQAALQEAERCQASRTDAERTLQRDREEHQRAQEKHIFESSNQRDTIQSLSQKLSKAEARANSLENECHRNALTVAEKGVLLETLAREKDQALAKLKELEATVLSEREQASRAGVKQEAMQERLAQAQSENTLLRQKLEEALNKGSAKDKAVTDVHQNFAEMLNQLRADGEERVHLVEERSKELAKTNSELREQGYKLEQEKAEREDSLRQLQQELADCLRKLSMCEASLEVNTRYRNDLEEEKARTLKDMDRLKGKLQESEEVYVQAEKRISKLKSSLDDKEREACSTAQKLEEALAASTGKEQTVKQLEEAVQRLEIENARLEAMAKQQTNRIEVLQKGVQEGAVVSSLS